MAIKSQDIFRLSAGSPAMPWAGNLDETLDTGETVTAVSISPLKAGAATTEIALSSVAASTAELSIKGETVATGRAIQCLIDATDAVIGTTYTLRATITTSATSRQEIIEFDGETY